MNSDFPRVLTLLRKEKGISQKEAARSLNISQALLSHYEKGIRECGLEFVVRAARFYSVSSDYLLGLSPERTGVRLNVEDIPNAEDGGKENTVSKAGILPTLNKKLITNSLNILFDLLAKCNNKGLLQEVSGFLMLAVYRMFRVVYSVNPKNEQSLFAVHRSLANPKAQSQMILHEATAQAIANGDNPKELPPVKAQDKAVISTQSLQDDYPLFASSLFNLIQNSESDLQE